MKKKMPLIFMLFVALFILVLHSIGTYLYFYWRVGGYDKVVHFSGGFFVAFGCLSVIYLQRMPTVRRSHLFSLGFIAALVIGIAWEIFELKSGNTAFSDKNYWFDNGGDVIFDILGGLIAVHYFIRNYGRKEISS